jgi:hypothetical protein
MKSKILPIAIICLLWSCTDSTKKNETVVAEDTTKTTAFKPANFEEQLIYNRAVEAVIWGMPAVNSELFHESLIKAKGDYNPKSGCDLYQSFL